MIGKPEFTRQKAADWPSLTSSQLADLLGMTDRRVRQYVQQGIMIRDGQKYPMRENIRRYTDYLKANPSESADVDDLKTQKLRAETKEREAKAEKAQLDLDVRRGELISRKDMYREWVGRCVELRSAMMALPGEIGFRFTDEETRALVEEVTEDFVRKTLETWSREGPLTPRENGEALDVAGIEGADPA